MTCGLWVVWSCSLSVYHSVGPNCTNKVSSSETLGDFNSIIFFCSRGVLLKTKMMTSLLLQPLASIVQPFLAFLTVSTISFFISICQDLQGWNWTLLSAWFQMELAITCAATCIRQEICWPWTKIASQVIALYLNRPPKNQHDPVYTPETMKMLSLCQAYFWERSVWWPEVQKETMTDHVSNENQWHGEKADCLPPGL